eukprot:INCI1278.2.p1 GENE.INCI1278.2~~INCI1278.2.p1  ORF type:complete len:115 (-),score=6.00 INCI1278.2:289-633(-)
MWLIECITRVWVDWRREGELEGTKVQQDDQLSNYPLPNYSQGEFYHGSPSRSVVIDCRLEGSSVLHHPHHTGCGSLNHHKFGWFFTTKEMQQRTCITHHLIFFPMNNVNDASYS